jgi:hypothetical protein
MRQLGRTKGLILLSHHLTSAETDDKLFIIDKDQGQLFDKLFEPLGFGLAETRIGGGGENGSEEKIVSCD